MNRVGNLTGVTEKDGSTVSYSYDALYRLTNDVRTGTNPYSHYYNYDLAGNRTSSDQFTATYDAGNKIATYNTNYTVPYDGDGNWECSTSDTFTYDDLNHLTNCTITASPPTSRRGICRPSTATYSSLLWGRSLSRLLLEAEAPQAVQGAGGRLAFSQTTASPWFSAEGSFSGSTISDIAAGLRSGDLSASALPVQYVQIGDSCLIVNTRSSLALTQAGIPQSDWILVNVSSDPEAVAAMYTRLAKNELSVQGTETLRITGSGSNASTYVGSGSIAPPK